jgi:hypothetical protein
MRRKWWIGLILALVFGTLLIGCPTEPGGGPSRYTVWTDILTYAEYKSEFVTQDNNFDLNDNEYLRATITSSGWSQISPTLPNQGKHNWTESELKSYFTGRGLSSAQATTETAWLITTSHALFAIRSGNNVYILLK